MNLENGTMNVAKHETHYRCYYEKEWPLDEYGRPGGFYSLADLPIVEHRKISRPGVVLAKDEDTQKYFVRDKEHRTWEFWIPMDDVTIGSIINGGKAHE